MTRRYRSSFDLRDALTTAEALSPKPPAAEPTPEYAGVPLVAFGNDAPSVAPAPPVERVMPAPVKHSTLTSPPDTSSIAGVIAKLSALLDWLRSDPEVSRVLVLDDEGLPLIGSTVGDLSDAESLLAATGSVASAMKKLALATPGALSPDFEGHVGDSPVLQLVGLTAQSRAFVVGLSRKSPFGKRDVDIVRAAFARALSAPSVTGGTLRPGGAGRSGDS